MQIDSRKGNPAMDYREHEKTYLLFIGLTKYITLSLIALMAAMAYFLV